MCERSDCQLSSLLRSVLIIFTHLGKLFDCRIGSFFFSSVVLTDTFINDMQIASFDFYGLIHQSPVNVCMENVRIYILMGVYSSVA